MNFQTRSYHRSTISPLLLTLIFGGIGVLSLIWGIQQQSLPDLLFLLVGGGVALLFWRWLTAATWRPAVLLLTQVALQGIISEYAGRMANLLTWVLLLAFFVQIPRAKLPTILLSTRTQALTLIFLYCAGLSFVLAVPTVGILIDFAQAVTLFFIIGVMGYAFHDSKFLKYALWAVALSMAFMLIAALAEQYLGLTILRDAPKEFSKSGDYRLTGPGGTFSINRLAFITIFPISLIVSHLLANRAIWHFVPFSVLLVALAIIVFGLISTGSRGGIAGAVFALGVIWLRSRAKLTTGIIMALLLVIGIVFTASFVPEEVFKRSTGTSLLASSDIRLNTWTLAFNQFLQHPILGVGWNRLSSVLQAEYPLGMERAAFTAHNAVLDLLSESGIVGTVPFLMLWGYSFYVLWKASYLQDDHLDAWRLTMFAGFLGMTVANMTSAYHYERFFWTPIAFVVALEQTKQHLYPRSVQSEFYSVR